jgi:peptidoglycan/xylan/chitin deacetylase (PgdA/CDA1 family)
VVDDCVESFYDIAWPVFSKLNVSFDCSLITGAIGKYTANGTDQKVISHKQISRLSESGLVTFVSHSMSHPHFKNIDPSSIYNEISESKKIIESFQGYCDTFCYPYGGTDSISSESEIAIKEAGYKYALTTLGGFIMKGIDRYRIGRINIVNKVDNIKLRLYANGALSSFVIIKGKIQHNKYYSNKSPGGLIGC